jgi:serine/threonine protein kinase
MKGGELFERIKSMGSHSESDTAIIMKSLLRALVSTHEKQVVHRDLKPENLLFKDDDISSLKIVDFGLADKYRGIPLKMKCGSPGYVAPEVLNDAGYDCKADIFGAGIILYILLTGKFVFSGQTYKEVLAKNRKGRVPFPP